MQLTVGKKIILSFGAMVLLLIMIGVIATYCLSFY